MFYIVSFLWTHLYLKSEMEVYEQWLFQMKMRVPVPQKRRMDLEQKQQILLYFISITKSYWSISTWVLIFCHICASASLFSKCLAIAQLILTLSQLLSCCCHGGFIFVLRWPSLYMGYFEWCIAGCAVAFWWGSFNILPLGTRSVFSVCVFLTAPSMMLSSA